MSCFFQVSPKTRNIALVGISMSLIITGTAYGIFLLKNNEKDLAGVSFGAAGVALWALTQMAYDLYKMRNYMIIPPVNDSDAEYRSGILEL